MKWIHLNGLIINLIIKNHVKNKIYINNKMASTRSKNTIGNYNQQQSSYANANNYNTYENSFAGKAYKNALPELGFNPSYMPREAFSNNSIDIETALLGIGSTNLVNPQEPVKPKLTAVPNVSYFERNKLIMPDPLIIEKEQRPFPIPK